MPTRRTPLCGHEGCPCSCRLLLLPVAILHDDNQPNALRNSHRAVRNPKTHPNARNTRRAHHPGSTGDGNDTGKIEGSICRTARGKLTVQARAAGACPPPRQWPTASAWQRGRRTPPVIGPGLSTTGSVDREMALALVVVVVVLLLLLPAPPALAATVDLADIQGTVVPSGEEVRGVVEPGAQSSRRFGAKPAGLREQRARAHLLQVARRGSLWTPEGAWATSSRRRLEATTDETRALPAPIHPASPSTRGLPLPRVPPLPVTPADVSCAVVQGRRRRARAAPGGHAPAAVRYRRRDGPRRERRRARGQGVVDTLEVPKERVRSLERFSLHSHRSASCVLTLTRAGRTRSVGTSWRLPGTMRTRAGGSTSTRKRWRTGTRRCSRPSRCASAQSRARFPREQVREASGEAIGWALCTLTRPYRPANVR